MLKINYSNSLLFTHVKNVTKQWQQETSSIVCQLCKTLSFHTESGVMKLQCLPYFFFLSFFFKRSDSSEEVRYFPLLENLIVKHVSHF